MWALVPGREKETSGLHFECRRKPPYNPSMGEGFRAHLIGLSVTLVLGAGCSSKAGGGAEGDGGAGSILNPHGAGWLPDGILTGPGADRDHPAAFEGTRSGLVFSPGRGVHDGQVTVSISHPSGTELLYTLDGSDPRTSTNVLAASLPLTLSLDPAVTTNRFTAPGIVVRATVGGGEAAPGEVVTHTYLFLDQVVELSPEGAAPGAGWPNPTGGGREWPGETGGQLIDYGMDPEVTEDAEYAGLVPEALRALPSVSVVTDLGNLFNDETGIYVNADERGEEWERFASVELLLPNNSPGFQANAGLRIRGGYSRIDSNPKHAFRLFFRGSEYGTPKLGFPVFGSEGAAEFDRLDLRTAQNYSWSFEGDQYGLGTMTRDVFARDLQRELGQPYTRSRYYHLYLNGVYWGIYQSQERPEANYGESYLGGDAADYDTVKTTPGGDGYVVYASDGTLDAWSAIWDLSQQGFAADSNYFRLEGKDSSGTRDASLPVLVDIGNLIDYMLVIFYTGNYDGPVSKFFSNQVPNNLHSLRSRAADSRGFVFFAHDSEHTLMAHPVTVGNGVEENRASIGEEGGAANEAGAPDDAYQMRVGRLEEFHPQWLHHRLCENSQYRQRFALRAQEVLTANGPLTPSRTAALFDARAAEIETAIIAESARWGDVKASSPRTRNDDWLPAVEEVRTGFLELRTEILVQQLQELGLY